MPFDVHESMHARSCALPHPLYTHFLIHTCALTCTNARACTHKHTHIHHAHTIHTDKHGHTLYVQCTRAQTHFTKHPLCRHTRKHTQDMHTSSLSPPSIFCYTSYTPSASGIWNEDIHAYASTCNDLGVKTRCSDTPMLHVTECAHQPSLSTTLRG